MQEILITSNQLKNLNKLITASIQVGLTTMSLK